MGSAGTFAGGGRRTMRNAFIRIGTLYTRPAHTLQKGCFPWEDPGPHLTQDESVSLTTSRSVHPFFAQLTCVRNTQTTLRATSVAIGYIYALRTGDAV